MKLGITGIKVEPTHQMMAGCVTGVRLKNLDYQTAGSKFVKAMGRMMSLSSLFLNEPGKVFTNQELYDYVEPTNIDLPYMYDNYEWTHCEEEGISFKVRGYSSVSQLKQHFKLQN
mmetsp:Transcript_34736/g.43831  ORF Transcript_34736/g.43831 Transcript_34736/m.43831 type:complete len:115 (-) Transcript_34736:245-589(-)